MVLIPSSVAFASIEIQDEHIMPIAEPVVQNYSDPPSWADGAFNGTWGLTLLGVPVAELGWIEGYFSAVQFFGRIEGYFAESGEEEATAKLEGFIILFNLIGVISNISSNESTFAMGLGGPSENGDFYYRISLILGPSWYIAGKWREI